MRGGGQNVCMSEGTRLKGKAHNTLYMRCWCVRACMSCACAAGPCSWQREWPGGRPMHGAWPAGGAALMAGTGPLPSPPSRLWFVGRP